MASEALHRAAQAGDVGAVEAILSQPEGRAALSSVDRESWSPLHVAASHGHSSAVAAMLRVPEGRAALSAPNNHQQTPLHVAVSRRDHAMVASMLWRPECRSTLLKPDQDQRTPLHLAMAHGNFTMVVSMLQYPEGRASLSVGSDPARLLAESAAISSSGRALLQMMLRFPERQFVPMSTQVSAPLRSASEASLGGPLLLEAIFASCGCFNGSTAANPSVSRKLPVLKAFAGLLTQRVSMRLALDCKVRWLRSSGITGWFLFMGLTLVSPNGACWGRQHQTVRMNQSCRCLCVVQVRCECSLIESPQIWPLGQGQSWIPRYD